MLAGTAMAVPAPCLAFSAAATSAQGSALRDEITTFAPCSAKRSAMALPMPRDEPVITATLPVRENKLMSDLLCDAAKIAERIAADHRQNACRLGDGTTRAWRLEAATASLRAESLALHVARHRGRQRLGVRGVEG